MEYYVYESFIHYFNSYKKALKGYFGSPVSIGDEFKKSLLLVYNLYEDNFDYYCENDVRTPTDVFLTRIYDFENFPEYAAEVPRIFEEIISNYSMNGGRKKNHQVDGLREVYPVYKL